MSGTLNDLTYEVMVSDLIPVPGTPIPNGDTPHWSPLAHTLIYGSTEAVLVDPPITQAQTDRVAEWVESHARHVTAIYITHAHADHWLGTASLLEHFPDATVYAGAATAKKIATDTADDVPGALWTTLFPGQLPSHIRFPVQAVPADGFTIDGRLLRSIDVGHTDTDDTTVLHVPAIGLVVAGDVVYNNVHLYLAEAADGGFDRWRQALDAVAALNPTDVVSSHQDMTRPNLPAAIAETRLYLDAAQNILETATTRLEFFTAITARFPGRINAYTTWLSALRLFEH
jgi:glyoxylase-like metal-dependent hydrolase (beta-lactamase superfamily II)